jgi:hypothetical protein
MQPELLIAFAPTMGCEREKADRAMAAGSVLWMKADSDIELKSPGTTATHVLAIRLLK